jgi:hypothetical protein
VATKLHVQCADSSGWQGALPGSRFPEAAALQQAAMTELLLSRKSRKGARLTSVVNSCVQQTIE